MTSTVLLRRSSAGPDGRLDNVPVRASFDDIKQHLKYLGPSNRASNPKSTRSTTVKIKPGIVVHDHPQSAPVAEETIPEVPRDEEGEDENETTSLLRGKIIPKDGAHAVAQTYGATGVGSAPRSLENSPYNIKTVDTIAQIDQSTQRSARASGTDLTVAVEKSSRTEARSQRSSSSSETSPIDALSPYGSKKSLLARSGSITEQVVETRGIKKTVLETTSSNDEDDEHRHQRMASRSNLSLQSTGALSPVPGDGEEETSLGSSSVVSPSAGASASAANGSNGQNGGGSGSGGASKKKNRRKKRKGGKS